MNRFTFALCSLLLAFAGIAFAQQSATLSGSIVSENDLPAGTRVAVHLAESNNAWGLEVASVTPAAGTFTVVVDPVPAEQLRPFRSGAVLLPGLQNEYRVTPEDVSYARGLVNMYVDDSGNSGNRTRQTPEHMFSLWNTFSFTDDLGFGLGLTYQDSYFTTEDNTVEVPSYTRLDAAAFYRLTEFTRIQLNVENLLDEEYFPDAHSNTNISTGRPLNARLSLLVDF